jgi:hypothetical protein
MESPTPLTEYVDTLPAAWKWNRSFTPPPALGGEWQRWLANAQRAELDATLRYWATQSDRAKS